MFNLIRTGVLIAAMTALFMVVGYFIGGQTGIFIAFLVAAGTNLFAYWNADKMVLSMQGAVEVDPRRAPDLARMVETLAARAGIPTPKLYVIETAQPNAFATGRNPQNAAVAVSSGLLNTLGPDEVAGVIAHELAHIKNRDTLTMTITATLAGAISMLGNFAFLFGGNRGNNSNPFGFIGVIVAMVVAPFAAMLVQMAISRTREYSADRRGAEICGKPLALASALSKIAGTARQVPNYEAERNPATAHMFIINPLSGERMDNLFSTHPNTDNRIAALQQMAGEFRGDIGGGGSTGQSSAARPQRSARSVPNSGSDSRWGRSSNEPPKGPWS